MVAVDVLPIMDHNIIGINFIKEKYTMKMFKFIVPQDLVVYMDRIQNEVITHRRVINSMFYSNLNNPSILDNEVFNKHNERYIETVAQLEMCKEEIITLLIPEVMRTSEHQCAWHLDFSTHELSIIPSGNDFDTWTEEDYFHELSTAL